MRVAIVIPLYNEQDNVAPLLQQIVTAMNERMEYEIICVDDGSSDSTLAVLLASQTNVKQLRIIRHKQCCGQSTALASGVKAALAPWIVTLDGDLQNDPADIPRLMDYLEQQQNAPRLKMIAGWRKQRRDSWVKRVSSIVANNIRKRLLHDETPDTGCGIKLFSRAVFLELPFFDHLHRFLPALFMRAGYEVVSVVVNHRPRTLGESKYGTFNRLWVGIVDICGVIWLLRRMHIPELDIFNGDAEIIAEHAEIITEHAENTRPQQAIPAPADADTTAIVVQNECALWTKRFTATLNQVNKLAHKTTCMVNAPVPAPLPNPLSKHKEIDDLHAMVVRLHHTLTALLNLTTLENRASSAEPTIFDLKQLLEHTLSIHIEEIGNALIAVKLNIYTDVPLQLMGSPEIIAHIFKALLRSVTKSVPPSPITIRVMLEAESPENAVIAITLNADNGAPLSAPNLFVDCRNESVFNACLQGEMDPNWFVASHMLQLVGGDMEIGNSEDGQSVIRILLTCCKYVPDPTADELLAIDTDLALTQVAGNSAVAKANLEQLIEILPDQQKDINRAFGEKDLNTMQSAVHSLHGATRYCGVPALQNAVNVLENNLESEDFHQIRTSLERFNYEVKRFLQQTNAAGNVASANN